LSRCAREITVPCRPLKGPADFQLRAAARAPPRSAERSGARRRRARTQTHLPASWRTPSARCRSGRIEVRIGEHHGAFLPPSSKTVPSPSRGAFMMADPGRRLAGEAMHSHRGADQRLAGDFGPKPCTRLKTPLVHRPPAALRRAVAAEEGVSSEGLATTAFPHASAGATFQVMSRNGSSMADDRHHAHGFVPPIVERAAPSVCPSRSIRTARQRQVRISAKFAAPPECRSRSPAGRVLPCRRSRRSTNSQSAAPMRSATLRSSAQRSGVDRRAHARAAPRARLYGAIDERSSASVTVARTRPLTGLMFSSCVPAHEPGHRRGRAAAGQQTGTGRLRWAPHRVRILGKASA